MLKKRIIPCLDIKDNQTVKGVNFLDLKVAGDPITLAKKYVETGADELVFLDITATLEKRKTTVRLMKQVAKEINIPFTVGGGINSLEHASEMIFSGADKISVNSAAIKRPALISEIADKFGRQCVVVAIDTKFINEKWVVTIDGGTKLTDHSVFYWAKKAEKLGAGELLITSMNNDGMKTGFAVELMQKLSQIVSLPMIASGGAGCEKHFKDLFEQTGVTGGLAASIFHFGEVGIPELKTYLKQYEIPIRL